MDQPLISPPSSRRPKGLLGDGAVLTLSEAVAELGLRESDGAAWLRAEGLVSTITLPSGATRERVVWRRVLERLSSFPDQSALSPARSRPTGRSAPRRSTSI